MQEKDTVCVNCLNSDAMQNWLGIGYVHDDGSRAEIHFIKLIVNWLERIACVRKRASKHARSFT